MGHHYRISCQSPPLGRRQINPDGRLSGICLLEKIYWKAASRGWWTCFQNVVKNALDSLSSPGHFCPSMSLTTSSICVTVNKARRASLMLGCTSVGVCLHTSSLQRRARGSRGSC